MAGYPPARRRGGVAGGGREICGGFGLGTGCHRFIAINPQKKGSWLATCKVQVNPLLKFLYGAKRWGRKSPRCPASGQDPRGHAKAHFRTL